MLAIRLLMHVIQCPQLNNAAELLRYIFKKEQLGMGIFLHKVYSLNRVANQALIMIFSCSRAN